MVASMLLFAMTAGNRTLVVWLMTVEMRWRAGLAMWMNNGTSRQYSRAQYKEGGVTGLMHLRS